MTVATRVCEAIRRRRVAVIAGVLVVSAVLGVCALRLDRDNSLAAWVSHDDPAWRRYQEFRAAFAVADPLMIYLPGTPVERAEGLVRVLRGLRGVAAATLLEVDAPAAGPKEASLVAVAPPPDADRRELARLAREVPEVVRRELPGANPGFGGVWWLNDTLDQWSDRAMRTFLPLVVVLLAGTLVLLMRDLRDAAVALVAGFLPAAQLAGLMALCGQPLNMLLVAVPPLTLILGITYAIHFLLQSRGAPAGGRVHAIAEVVSPTLGSAGTTMLGFGSLLFSSLEPVQRLGLWGAVGVALSLATALALVPALAHARPAAPAPAGRVGGWMRVLRRGHRWIPATVAIATVAASLGIGRIRTESHVLSFFAPDAAIRRDYRLMETAGIGLTPVEIELHVTPSEYGQVRDWLSDFAEAHAPVTHILWPMDAAARLRVPDATTRGAGLTLHPLPEERTAPPVGGDAGRPRTDARRITLLLRTLTTGETVAFLDDLERSLGARLAGRGSAAVTGSVALLVRMQDWLLRTQLWSFGSAFFTIVPVMILNLRSLRLGLYAIVPNLLPVVLMLGVMGWCGISLDVATVTVASITFSVIVDDTIHFLHRYGANRKRGLGVDASVEDVLAGAGYSMVTATAATGIGFLGFLAAPFIPLRDFGLLTSLTLWAGLVFDVLVSPAFLLAFGRRGPAAGEKPAGGGEPAARPCEVGAGAARNE